MATYNGTEIFFPAVNWETPPTFTYKRDGARLDTKSGKWAYDDHANVPKLEPQMVLWLKGRPAILGLLDWAARRKGKALPFWMPSYRRDLTIMANGTAGDAGILLHDTGYVLRQFPYACRRHIILCTGQLLDHNMVYRVTAASNGPGNSSSLTFSENLRENVLTVTPVMFFHLLRLTEDKVEVRWLAKNFAECTLSVTELPLEYPL